MTEPLSTLTIAMLRKPLADLYTGAKNGVRRRFRATQTEARIRSIYKAITSVQKVKTLWKIDREVKLSTFYYPSKVLIGDKKKAVDQISEIEKSANFVIQGTVGQGKSIFLRYLCIRELSQSKRVPIFLELRRIDPKKSLRHFILDNLKIYALPADEEAFEYLAQSGKIVLLLDAFDEIESDTVTAVLNELELLAQQFQSMQIVVTSRPESGIEKSPHFRVYQLAPLERSDHRPFLEKIVSDKSRVNELLAAIDRSATDIRALLKTPLLMTLLVIVYNSTQQVPPSLSAFYDVLFNTLTTRHDGSKPGFRRRRLTKLSDADLNRLFSAFCYAARQLNLLVIGHGNVEKLLLSASIATGIKVDPDDFSSDITKVTCLMQREGFDLEFIHKSVAEFHAAKFLASRPEETVIKFYTAVQKDKWTLWRQELVFLEQLDRYRFLTHFYIPSASRLLRRFEIEPSAEVVEIDSDQFRRAMNQYRYIPPKVDKPAEQRAPSLRLGWEEWGHEFAGEASEVHWVHKCFDIANSLGSAGLPYRADGYPIGDLVTGTSEERTLKDLVLVGLNKVHEQLRAAQQEIGRENKVRDFVDP